MEQRRRRAAAWLDAEAKKLRSLSWKGRAAYLWDYYKLWILGLLCAAALLPYLGRQIASGGREDWFNVCFANTYAELGNGSRLWRDYALYAGYDLGEGNLTFNARSYVDPTREDYGNEYYRLLIAAMDSETLDAVVMEPERLAALGASGRLLDLEDPRAGDLFQRYGDRLVWCTPLDPAYGKDRVAVGISLDGAALPEGAYPQGAALGINALAPHPDQAAVFLSFLLDA